MADKNSGWACTQNVSVVAETNSTVTIRVKCYWQNQGWRYDMNHVSAWVYMNGSAVCVKDNGSIDTTGNNQAAYEMGRHDFVVNKTTSAQSIPFCAKITSNSSYVSGTKWSGDQYVTVAALPSHTVSYNANGGSGAPGAQTKWYGSILTLSSSRPSRTGYTFQGWATSASGGVAYQPGGSYGNDANITLYAVWTPHTYTVSYNANGGSGAPGNQTKTYGVNLALSSTIPTRTNYNFKGWSTSANGGVVYAAGATYTNNSAVTLYAVWELAYIKPRISSFRVNRCTSDGTISETGTYLKYEFSWQTDRAVTTIALDWKNQGDSTWSYVHVSGASGTSGTVSQVVGDGQINIESSYHARAYVDDGTGNTHSVIVSIGTVKFPIDVKAFGKGVAFGKVAEKNNLFDVAWDANFDKSVKGQKFNSYFIGAFSGATWVYVGDFNFDTQGQFSVIDCYLGNGQNGGHMQNTHMKIILKQGYSSTGTGGIGVTTNFTQNYSPSSTIQVKILHSTNYSCKLYIYLGFSWNDLTCIVNGSHKSFIPSMTKIGTTAPTTDKESTYYYNGGYALYDNQSGTNGTVTLNTSAGDFNYLEIYCKNDQSYFSHKICLPNGRIASLMTAWHTTESGYALIQYVAKRVTISGTSITATTYGATNTRADGTIWVTTSDNYIKIIRVVGYR